MIDLKLLREHPETVKKAVVDKRAKVDVDAVIKLDAERRRLSMEIEEIQRQRNEAAKAKDVERGRAVKADLAK
ncbi:MAG: serine--tRNA ligase, partial [Patescibacteria group bacterium]